jgi:Ca2+-binding RTX toxin-like protein
VSYTDGQGTKESVTSKQTDLVTNHAPTGEIVINGDAKVGEVLSIVNTLADVDGLGDFSYQWLIDGFNPYMNSVISNTDTFVISESSMMGSTAGKTISVKVSYFDGEGTDEVVVSEPTLAVVVTASSEPTFGNDKLVGTDKKDTLSALAGNDTIIGEVGTDTLTGGQGADMRD